MKSKRLSIQADEGALLVSYSEFCAYHVKKENSFLKGGILKGKQITKNSSAVPKATCSRGGIQAKLDF